MTTRKTSSPLYKYLSVGVTILVLGAGIVTAWASTKSTVAEMQRNQVKLEQRISKNEERMLDVQLKAVAEASTLRDVKEDVAEIKKDVKELLKR